MREAFVNSRDDRNEKRPPTLEMTANDNRNGNINGSLRSIMLKVGNPNAKKVTEIEFLIGE